MNNLLLSTIMFHRFSRNNQSIKVNLLPFKKLLQSQLLNNSLNSPNNSKLYKSLNNQLPKIINLYNSSRNLNIMSLPSSNNLKSFISKSNLRQSKKVMLNLNKITLNTIMLILVLNNKWYRLLLHNKHIILRIINLL
jgi:hypothetical protein